MAEKKGGRIDYEKYKYSVKELLVMFFGYSAVTGAVAFFFYRSFLVYFILLPGFWGYMKLERNNRINARKAKLSEEFSEMLCCMSANVCAGYALENAVLESRKDMLLFYGPESLMAKEILFIKSGLGLNQNLENLIADLGKRSGVEDIKIFSDVFLTAKRSGGDIKKMLMRTSETIKAKTLVEKEIQVLVSQKKLEFRIMELIPFFIIAYVGISSKGYFDILYHNLRGILFMSVSLVVYFLSIILGKKMVNIHV